MSFFVCIHYTVLLERAYWLLGIATTSTTSADVWPHQVVLVQSCYVGYCWWDEGWPTRIQEERGGLKNPSLSFSISTTSGPARAGHQTCKGLMWQLRPLQPAFTLLTWRPRQCSRWRSMSCWWVWSWPSTALPALLCRDIHALGHKNSHDQLVWKSTTNFF